MTEEIINSDGSRNWEANILLDNVKRLEQENKELKSVLEKIKDLCIHYKNTNDKCVINCYAHFIVTDLIQNKINEALQ